MPQHIPARAPTVRQRHALVVAEVVVPHDEPVVLLLAALALAAARVAVGLVAAVGQGLALGGEASSTTRV